MAVSSNAPKVGEIVSSPVSAEGFNPTSGIINLQEDERNPYYALTNAAPVSIKYKDKLYQTANHLFYAKMFLPNRPQLAEHIRVCGANPRQEADRFSPEYRQDGQDVCIALMDEVLSLKFQQHFDLQIPLLSTGEAELVLYSKDNLWGYDESKHSGKNEFGKALFRLRTTLREGGRPSTR